MHSKLNTQSLRGTIRAKRSLNRPSGGLLRDPAGLSHQTSISRSVMVLARGSLKRPTSSAPPYRCPTPSPPRLLQHAHRPTPHRRRAVGTRHQRQAPRGPLSGHQASRAWGYYHFCLRCTLHVLMPQNPKSQNFIYDSLNSGAGCVVTCAGRGC